MPEPKTTKKKRPRRRYNVLSTKKSHSKEYTGPPTRDEDTTEALKEKQEAKRARRAKQLAHLPVVGDKP